MRVREAQRGQLTKRSAAATDRLAAPARVMWSFLSPAVPAVVATRRCR